MAVNRLMDPIGKLMGLRYKSHPWHGVEIGPDAPEIIISFIEMVSTDTVKYEVDKVAEFCMEKSGKKDIKGDADPIDICVLTEKEIVHGDILVRARPIGGFRMIDGNESDDKLVAVLNNDAMYAGYKDISDLPEMVVDRLKHYFLTYKDLPENQRDVEITDVFGKEDAYEIISRSQDDYQKRFENLENILSSV